MTLTFYSQLESQPHKKTPGRSFEEDSRSLARLEFASQRRCKQDQEHAINGSIHDEHEAKEQEGKERLLRCVRYELRQKGEEEDCHLWIQDIR